MFDEGRRRRERNREDVVVGAVQAKYSPEIEQLLLKHEIIPPLKIDGREAIDLAAIFKRRPQVVLIDGLAYDNPPGTRNAKRWQDVEELLEAGISVITSVNLRHIEECREEVERITGKRTSQTVPKSFLEKTDEVVIVDAPAEVILERAGVVPKSDTALAVEEEKLSRLREMALLIAAEVVDRQLEGYLKVHGIESTWGMEERILVCLTPKSDALQMIESGRRNADRFHGDLYVAYVRQPSLSRDDEAAIGRMLALARQMGAQVEVLEQQDPVNAIIAFARQKGITQIFIGHSKQRAWWQRLRGNPVDRLIRSAEGIDIQIFPQAKHP